METAELDVALEELELRLERLRALYEQYFMGLERIEPGIARKDVDRRIYVLRREKIRNTAKRFKLQTIIQRYNTFQQYWQRICREIENGTYKRHLLKAQKNNPQLLTIAARKRLGRAGRTSQPPDGAEPSQPPSAQSAPPPGAPPAATPVPAPEPVAAAATPLGAPPLPRRPPPPRSLEGAPVAPAAAGPAPTPAPIAAKPVAPARPAPAKFESLDLDMDFMGDWDPGTTRGPAPKPAAPAAKPVAPLRPATPAAPPRPPAPVKPPLPVAARPASIPPAPVATPPRPASMRPPTAPARPPAPRVPPSPRIPAPPAAAPPKPASPKPAPPPVAAPKPAPPAASAASADEARLRDLHTRLQQAKQQTKEANVSYEGLAKSIRATEAKLREQHKNRKIDFDVVIKDGKAVVKPIVR